MHTLHITSKWNMELREYHIIKSNPSFPWEHLHDGKLCDLGIKILKFINDNNLDYYKLELMGLVDGRADCECGPLKYYIKAKYPHTDVIYETIDGQMDLTDRLRCVLAMQESDYGIGEHGRTALNGLRDDLLHVMMVILTTNPDHARYFVLRYGDEDTKRAVLLSEETKGAE